jgi:UDP-N-acetyl-D-galactosamine dehydrogenase
LFIWQFYRVHAVNVNVRALNAIYKAAPKRQCPPEKYGLSGPFPRVLAMDHVSLSKVGIVGLGYVGLPVAVALAERYPGTIGFDINAARVAALTRGEDATGEVDNARLRTSKARFTVDIADLRDCGIFIVCVPTPIHADRRPDLDPLRSASEVVGKVLKKGDIVCYESTVYPGVTEEFCGPILAQVSGLTQGRDFKLGYSPERINPGDKVHTFENIIKIVSGEDEATTQVLAGLYGSVVHAGVHLAPSIKVAEAAKVLENTQRDLNIALMNEFAIICSLLEIRTTDVLAAAGTKWNFLKFTPGLVGGHCIGVDPYYITSKAQELGYHSEVILSGRRVNNYISSFIAHRTLQMMRGAPAPSAARVGILGLTFKENVPDIRNSRVPDIVRELGKYGIRPMIADSLADAEEVRHEYGLELSDIGDFRDCDALILAVPHQDYVSDPRRLYAMLKPSGVMIDVRSGLSSADVPTGIGYWSL